MKSIGLLKQMYKIILYGYKSSSPNYVNYLRKKGISIGENTTFYEPNTNYVDTQKPWLIKIGNNVEITRGVTIISHDYAWSVIKQCTGEIIGSRGKVEIGNNVFIGMNSLILQGTTIGDNVIIGANSLVKGIIPDGTIVVGCPARCIGTINDYIEKRKNRYEEDAIEMFVEYYKQYNKIPSETNFDEFFWLFKKREDTVFCNEFDYKLHLTGNYERTISMFKETKPLYDGYEEFVKKCMERIN